MSKILFLGAGNMGQAIIGGILKKNIFKSNEISIYEINDSTKKTVIEKYKVNELTVIDSNISKFDYIILAVKPQTFSGFSSDGIMKNIPKLLNKNQIVISIMAGVTISKMVAFFGNETSIVRVMPNAPAFVGEGMSVLAPSEQVDKEKLQFVKNIFESIGLAEIMEEKYLDAVTGLSGSGPAYVFMFVEALTQGGIFSGLAKPVAEKLAVQTVLGSIKMIEGSKSVEDLRHMVTSPAGTTIEGVSVLEANGFRSAVMEAVKAATERSKELGKN